jgi:arsenate reductase
MAEAIARRNAADLIVASSAGLTPLGHIEPMTKKTLARNGFSSDELRSKPVTVSALEAADIVINMSGLPREAAFKEPTKVEDWCVEDPYGADAELYQRIFEDIRRRVSELAERLRNGEGSGVKSENIKQRGGSGQRQR